MGVAVLATAVLAPLSCATARLLWVGRLIDPDAPIQSAGASRQCHSGESRIVCESPLLVDRGVRLSPLRHHDDEQGLWAVPYLMNLCYTQQAAANMLTSGA